MSNLVWIWGMMALMHVLSKIQANHHITVAKIKHCVLRWSTLWSSDKHSVDTLPTSTLVLQSRQVQLKRNYPEQGFQQCCFSVILTKLLLSAWRVAARVPPLRISQLAKDRLQNTLALWAQGPRDLRMSPWAPSSHRTIAKLQNHLCQLTWIHIQRARWC